jgi:hypothetical protein
MSAPQTQDTEELIIDQFQKWISADTETSVAVYGIKALLEVIKRSKASTMMELQMDLDKAKKVLHRFVFCSQFKLFFFFFFFLPFRATPVVVCMIFPRHWKETAPRSPSFRVPNSFCVL